jgi:hypothetical protein
VKRREAEEEGRGSAASDNIRRGGQGRQGKQGQTRLWSDGQNEDQGSRGRGARFMYSVKGWMQRVKGKVGSRVQG